MGTLPAGLAAWRKAHSSTSKNKAVTGKQAKLTAQMMGKSKMPMDAEDMVDKGVDESTEKN